MNQTYDTYEDIINLPHHVSKSHPQMSEAERAAQFAPFAALTGHDDAIRETARRTDVWKQPTQEMIDQLNRKLGWLKDKIKEQNTVTVTYFVPDEKKDGGFYLSHTGTVKKIDSDAHYLLLDDTDTEIPFRYIYDLEIQVR